MELTGLDVNELFERGDELAYADFRILDTFFSELDDCDIDLSTCIGRELMLKTPIIASPMDTVTNSDSCIAIAKMGGIGCIHMNHRDSSGNYDFNRQLAEVSMVKNYDCDISDYPLATKDAYDRLSVLFAVETRKEFAFDRLKMCFESGADGVVIDTSQGYGKYEKSMVENVRDNYPDKLVIGGNISTREAFVSLDNWGVDACRVGQGAGSICTTALAIGISRASATSVYECASLERRMRSIADGGIKSVGDILKALALGADAVMLGNMLAGTDESPGEIITSNNSGRKIKIYRGMGSKEANTDGIRGYNKLPQGVSGFVEYKGSLIDVVDQYRDGLISGMKVLNCRNLSELRTICREHKLRFGRNTPSSTFEMGASVRASDY